VRAIDRSIGFCHHFWLWPGAHHPTGPPKRWWIAGLAEHALVLNADIVGTDTRLAGLRAVIATASPLRRERHLYGRLLLLAAALAAPYKFRSLRASSVKQSGSPANMIETAVTSLIGWIGYFGSPSPSYARLAKTLKHSRPVRRQFDRKALALRLYRSSSKTGVSLKKGHRVHICLCFSFVASWFYSARWRLCFVYVATHVVSRVYTHL